MLDNTKGRTPCGRQYSRVIRWVNRAQSMSAGGKYSDAILDVECARAELDDARQELLLCHKTGSDRKKISPFALAVVTAFCAVFFMVTPLQVALLSERGQFSRNAGRIQSSAVSRPNSGDVPRRGSEAAAGLNADVFFAGDVLTDSAEFDSTEQLSEGDVFHLIEVGRNALEKKRSSLVLDFN